MSNRVQPPAPAPAFDERKIGTAISIGLPLATLAAAAVALLLVGPAMAILVLTAGVMLAVIALLWGSLRVLSGDAPLPPELEAIDGAARGIDALSSRKKMLLRALKDLANERAIGKIDEEDHEDVAMTYRAELKEVMRRIDESLAPHLEKAEALARAHLTKVGLAESGYRGDLPPEAKSDPEPVEKLEKDERTECPKCDVSNEPDAKFCKGCGATLAEVKDEA